MKLLFRYVLQHKKLLILALVLATINQVFSLLDPQIFRMLIDDYANKATMMDRDTVIKGVAILLGGSVGVAGVSRIAKNFQDYFTNVIVQRVGAKMYADSIAHAFSLPYAVFEDQRSGELLQKVQKARIDAQAVIQGAINILYLSVIGVVFVLSYAFTVNWIVGAVYTSIIPILGIVTFYISRKIKDAQKSIVRETAELAGSTTETIRNVELVKSLGLETQEINRLNEVNKQILGLELKKIVLVRKLSFIQGTLLNALRSSLLFLMLYLIVNQSITLGQFFSLLFYSFYVFNPLQELGSVSAQYQEARASLETLDEVLARPSDEKPENPVKIEKVKEISFSGAGFQYQSSDRDVLKKLDISIKAGETVAFVGPSGSGKSTVMKLIVGLYRPTAGKLMINDVPSTEVDYDDLRRRTGLVTQETQLFAGSIRDNLLFVRPDATDEECLAALKAAAAMNIIEKADKGLDTKIGEGGIKISGGERQRLAIARALLRKPELIIFDEATSSLDSITELAITQTIKEITSTQKGIINILVAHRLSTIIHADRIFVLEKGVLIEQGSHEELLAQNGLYNALWRQQSGEASE